MLTTENIHNAMKTSNFWLDKTSLEAQIVNDATTKGYIVRLSHTQVQWTEEGIKKAKKELMSEEKINSLTALAETHLIRLAPLSDIPLSTQLLRITGDAFTVDSFVNYDDNNLTAKSCSVIMHIKTGLRFLIP